MTQLQQCTAITLAAVELLRRNGVRGGLMGDFSRRVDEVLTRTPAPFPDLTRWHLLSEMDQHRIRTILDRRPEPSRGLASHQDKREAPKNPEQVVCPRCTREQLVPR